MPDAALLDAIRSDMAEVKATMRQLADAVTKLAVVEERQSNDRAAIGRAFKELEDHEQRIKSLEQAQPLQKQTTDWVNRVVGQIITMVAAVLAGAVISNQVLQAPAPKSPTVKSEPQRTTQ